MVAKSSTYDQIESSIISDISATVPMITISSIYEVSSSELSVIETITLVIPTSSLVHTFDTIYSLVDSTSNYALTDVFTSETAQVKSTQELPMSLCLKQLLSRATLIIYETFISSTGLEQ